MGSRRVPSDVRMYRSVRIVVSDKDLCHVPVIPVSQCMGLLSFVQRTSNMCDTTSKRRPSVWICKEAFTKFPHQGIISETCKQSLYLDRERHACTRLFVCVRISYDCVYVWEISFFFLRPEVSGCVCACVSVCLCNKNGESSQCLSSEISIIFWRDISSYTTYLSIETRNRTRTSHGTERRECPTHHWLGLYDGNCAFWRIRNARSLARFWESAYVLQTRRETQVFSAIAISKQLEWKSKD